MQVHMCLFTVRMRHHFKEFLTGEDRNLTTETGGDCLCELQLITSSTIELLSHIVEKNASFQLEIIRGHVPLRQFHTVHRLWPSGGSLPTPDPRRSCRGSTFGETPLCSPQPPFYCLGQDVRISISLNN